VFRQYPEKGIVEGMNEGKVKSMFYQIKDMFYQLGIETVHELVNEVYKFNILKSYIHYDELEPFTKLHNFKGVSCKGDNIVLEFLK
jgi:hypothetical protein